MAIDNLYTKCGEGIVRVKHTSEQFIENIETKKTKPKKGQDKNKKK